MPFILAIIFLPIYFLFFFIFHKQFDNLLSAYVIGILSIVVLNFLYGQMIIVNRIKNRKIHKVTEEFIVQKKDTYSYTSETMSNSDYYRLYLINNKNQRRGIYISSEDFKKISINEKITVTYFEIVNIIEKVIYRDQEIKYARFFSLNKIRLPL